MKDEIRETQKMYDSEEDMAAVTDRVCLEPSCACPTTQASQLFDIELWTRWRMNAMKK